MSRARRIWGWSATCVLVAVVAAIVVIKYTVGWFCVIPQNGMYPVLPAGSWLFTIKNPYRDVSQVARGDIVVFERDEGGKRYLYVWRVIGLPGETIEIAGDKVIVNGKEAAREKVRAEGDLDIYRETDGDQSYEVAYSPKIPAGIPDTLKVTVPGEHLFVMGDNRHHAADSRSFGPIPFRSVIAKKW